MVLFRSAECSCLNIITNAFRRYCTRLHEYKNCDYGGEIKPTTVAIIHMIITRLPPVDSETAVNG